MNPGHLQLQADLDGIVEFFATDEMAMQLPFMHSFPKNCCEVVSALAAQVLAAKYPEAAVVRIRGTSQSKSEHHFWVEVNGCVVDPTAHQFESVLLPVICSIPSPLAAQFPSIDRESPASAAAALHTLSINAAAQASLLDRLGSKLGPNPSVKGTCLRQAPCVERLHEHSRCTT